MSLGPALAWLLAAASGSSSPPSPPAPAPPEAATPLVFGETVEVAERAPRDRAEIPAAVAALDRDRIARLPATNLAELLDTLPGFQVLFAAGFGAAPIVRTRGFFGAGEAEYVQVRVDGVPLGDPESGLVDLRALRAANLERAELLRGPGSSFYGDTALGGVIELRTRAAAAATHGRVTAALASFSTGEADAAHRADRGLANLELIAAGASTRGFRRFGDSRDAQLELRLAHDFSAGPARLQIAGGERHRGEPGPLSAAAAAADRSGANPLFEDDREDRRWWRAAASWDRHSAAAPMRARLHWRETRSDFLRTLLLAPDLGDAAARATTTRALGASVEGALASWPPGWEAELGWGVDLGRDWLETSYRRPPVAAPAGPEASLPTARVEARRDRAGLFAAPSFRLSPALRVTTGLRWDRVADRHRETAGRSNETASAWSPRLGFAARLGGGGKRPPYTAFVQAAKAFKAPTLDQRFDPRPFPDFAGGSFSISNPRLAPQRALHLEAGLARASRAGRVELVAYRTEVEDEIDFDPLSFRYVNLGSSRHRGAELELELRPQGPLRPRLSYAWTGVEPRRGDNRGRQLKNIPVHLVRAGLSADLPRSFSVEIEGAWRGERYLDDANRFPLADAATIDLRLARASGRLRVHLDLLNATGEEYDALGYVLSDFSGQPIPHLFPAPGRAWRLGASLEF